MLEIHSQQRAAHGQIVALQKEVSMCRATRTLD